MWSVLSPQPCSVLFCSSVESVSGEQQTVSGRHFPQTRAAAGAVWCAGAVVTLSSLKADIMNCTTCKNAI